MKKKILFASILLFMVLTFILPIEDKVSHHLSGLAAFLVNPGQYFVIVFTLMLTVLLTNMKGLSEYINKRINLKYIYILIYLVEIVTFTLFVLRVTEIWGTWSTFGLYAITVLSVPILLEKEIPKTDALFLGVGLVYLMIGLWEMPYQYGLWKFYELPQGETTMDVVNQIVFLIPFIILGCAIISIIIVNNYKSMKFKWLLPAMFMAITVTGFIVRFANNFWTDMYYDLKTSSWIYTQINVGMLELARFTKVTLVLSCLTIFNRRNNG